MKKRERKGKKEASEFQAAPRINAKLFAAAKAKRIARKAMTIDDILLVVLLPDRIPR
jgi:hypothetical protein